jgi:flagellar protein FliS
MPGDEVRARYLRDRVMTATPAQRVVMLYDRLGLDLTRAGEEPDEIAAGKHVSHAMEIVAELRASLDITAGGPADNLAAIYAFLLRELVAVRTGQLAR